MEEKWVLVVDDEPCVSESIVLKIGRISHLVKYRVVSCASATRALQLSEKQNFSLVITDIRMPFIMGTQLVKELRERGYQGAILVLSGYDDFNYVREAFINGADDYMLKPVSVGELDKKLNELLNQEPEVHRHSKAELEPAEPEPVNSAGVLPEKNGLISYALDFMNKRYGDSSLTMEDVANHISVSYSYFSSLFRKETGITFPTYLRELRIRRALELLEDPAMKISDICYRVGFKYPQQFSNEFKKVTGVYPSQYFTKKGE